MKPNTDTHKPSCEFEGKPEWSGSPARNDTGWTCDSCGVFIPVEALQDVPVLKHT